MNAEKIIYDALVVSGYPVYAQFATPNKKNPVVVYNVTSDTTITGLTDYVDVQQARFQVDLYADEYNQLKTMKDDVYRALRELDSIYVSIIIYGSSDSHTKDGRRTSIDLKAWVKPQ